ncbi:hypothetical protein U9M48_029110 [Paspalum notatum var. saurae]|uniref:Uncharacterized protein n=1 Tax=Paspalum notatum var. saurae TaxID=547442 RepID=A0AAQ3TY73_PASNO
MDAKNRFRFPRAGHARPPPPRAACLTLPGRNHAQLRADAQLRVAAAAGGNQGSFGYGRSPAGQDAAARAISSAASHGLRLLLRADMFAPLST